MQDLVIRIKPRNGKDSITVGEVLKALCPDGVFGVERWIVQEVEGNTLELETLAITAQQIIKKHIVDPLANIPLKMCQDMNTEWNRVKDRIEPLLAGKFTTCAHCAVPVLTGHFNEGCKHICAECAEVSYWHFLKIETHPEGGRWILSKTKV